MTFESPEDRISKAGGRTEIYPPRHRRHDDDHASDDADAPTLYQHSLEPVGKSKISPRPWAYGSFLLLGKPAVLGAMDGGGKGAIAVVIMLAMITGKALLGERVWRTGPVAIVTYEDDEDEWHRRIAAACEHYQLDYKYVLANIRFIGIAGGRISFASPDFEGKVSFPHSEPVISSVRKMRAVLLIIDPLNHAHDLPDGNNNVLMAKLAGELTRVAEESGAAILVLHHLRKGSNGNPDDLMGATSLRATFRTCRILACMTAKEATDTNTPEPWRFIRITGSKENYAPPPEKATWYRLIGVPLGNQTDRYPDGDDVAVAVPWSPRSMFEGMDASTLAAVFEALRHSVHGPHRQAKNTPWAGGPLIEKAGRSLQEATTIVNRWIENKVLIVDEYYHSGTKHKVKKVTLDEVKANEILAPLRVSQ